MDLFKELKDRGFIYQATDEEKLKKILNNDKSVYYCGFDPTAESLHIGNLLPLMALLWLKKNGNEVIAVVGGATGSVGDPSGKTETRNLLEMESIQNNCTRISEQIENFLSREKGSHRILNNYDWFKERKFLDFLREIGPLFSVNKMLTSDSVRLRLQSNTGITFLEFSYMLLQSFDFLYLREKHNCLVQIGGQDQWGNIVMGIDLIRRIRSEQTYGFTIPLLLNEVGEKFGKTVKGSVWLSAEKLSPYEYYQYWRNIPDSMLDSALKRFTFLPLEEIKFLVNEKNCKVNRAKEILGFEATSILHGFEEASIAFTSSVKEFGSADENNLVRTSSKIIAVRQSDAEIPAFFLSRKTFSEKGGIDIVTLLVSSSLSQTRSEAKRSVSQGGVHFLGEKIDKFDHIITLEDIEGKDAVLRVGKKKRKKIKISEN
ncbi:tyrosine--tRNA ligase [candidate division WOR-3 bacterium]|nr:tyrosine--tRNA ligase [candidate division WOR-3 bacterium]